MKNRKASITTAIILSLAIIAVVIWMTTSSPSYNPIQEISFGAVEDSEGNRYPCVIIEPLSKLLQIDKNTFAQSLNVSIDRNGEMLIADVWANKGKNKIQVLDISQKSLKIVSKDNVDGEKLEIGGKSFLSNRVSFITRESRMNETPPRTLIIDNNGHRTLLPFGPYRVSEGAFIKGYKNVVVFKKALDGTVESFLVFDISTSSLILEVPVPKNLLISDLWCYLDAKNEGLIVSDTHLKWSALLDLRPKRQGK